MHTIAALNGFSETEKGHRKIGGESRGGMSGKKMRGGFGYNTYLNV